MENKDMENKEMKIESEKVFKSLFDRIAFNILPNSIVVAYSSGADSNFLVDVLLRKGFSVEIAYFNHLLRGEESEEEEQFVKNYAEEKGLKLHLSKADVRSYAKERKLSIEEAARDLRYAFFESLNRDIATAHNLDDNVETFIFRMLRGTSLYGLKSIPKIRGRYFRPILNIGKKEILEYLAINDIKYFVDSSNASLDFSRNKIRSLFPIFEEINPKFREKISNLIEDIPNERDPLAELLKDRLDRNKLALVKELMTKDGSKEIHISKDLVLRKRYDKISLEKKEVQTKESLQTKELLENMKSKVNGLEKAKYNQLKHSELKIGNLDNIFKEYRVNFLDYEIIFQYEENYVLDEDLSKTKFTNTKETIYIDSDRAINLSLRTRREKDFFYFSDKRKSLKKFFIDVKVDKFSRDSIPLLCSDNEIIWVLGLRVSEKFKITNKTKRILKLSFTFS